MIDFYKATSSNVLIMRKYDLLLNGRFFLKKNKKRKGGKRNDSVILIMLHFYKASLEILKIIVIFPVT